MTDLTEALARAIWAADHPAYIANGNIEMYERHRAPYVERARACLAALDAAGFQIVPKEPTIEMTANGIESDDKRTGAETCKHIYRAMLAAAPKP